MIGPVGRDLRVAAFLASRSLARGNASVTVMTVLMMAVVFISVVFLPSLINGAVATIEQQVTRTATSDLIVKPAESTTIGRRGTLRRPGGRRRRSRCDHRNPPDRQPGRIRRPVRRVGRRRGGSRQLRRGLHHAPAPRRGRVARAGRPSRDRPGDRHRRRRPDRSPRLLRLAAARPRRRPGQSRTARRGHRDLPGARHLPQPVRAQRPGRVRDHRRRRCSGGHHRPRPNRRGSPRGHRPAQPCPDRGRCRRRTAGAGTVGAGGGGGRRRLRDRHAGRPGEPPRRAGSEPRRRRRAAGHLREPHR